MTSLAPTSSTFAPAAAAAELGQETDNDNSGDADDEVVSALFGVDDQARELRDRLDDLLESYQGGGGQEEGPDRAAAEQESTFMSDFVMLLTHYPQDAVDRAVLLTSDVAEDSPSYSARLPIHLACDKSAPPEAIRWLLEADSGKESILRKDKWGDLPIHTACSRRDSIDVIQLLLDADSEKVTVLTRDNYNYLPIHYACRYNAPPEVVRLLVEGDETKTSLLEEGIHGQLPLHVACRCNAPPSVVQILLDSDPDKRSVLREDSVGRLPIHVFLLRGSDLDVVRMLLGGMVCQRVERVGLDLWKGDVRGMIRSLATHERDSDARDRLDAIVAALERMLERAAVLELAAWRASCLAAVPRDDGIADLPREYKMERRIKSGAEVVVPGVLSFLEDEPIVEVVDELKKLGMGRRS